VFTEALGRFALALGGAYGDEGPVVASTLDQLDIAVRQWDAQIRGYEAGMAADIGSAPAALAVRMHVALGSVYLDRLRTADALRELALAAQIDPRRADVPALRSVVLAQLTNQPAVALAEVQKAVALAPGDAAQLYQLSRLLPQPATGADDALTRFLEARRADRGTQPQSPFMRVGLVEEVPGIEPFFPPAAYAAGFQLLREGRHPEAIARFRTALAADPLVSAPAATAAALGNGGAALRAGDTQAVIDRLGVLAGGTESSEVQRLLGLAHLAAEHDVEGLAALTAAVRLAPTSERARLDLANALFERSRLDDARAVLDDTVKALPDAGQAWYQLGRVQQRLGDYAAAGRSLGRAAALQPLLGLNSVYQTIGALHRSQQEYTQAMDAFRARTALVPNDPDAHQELAEMYVRLGRLTEGRAEYAVAVWLDPRHAGAWVGAGQIHLREGRLDEAAEAARRAVEIDARHKEARYLLATVLLRLGRAEEGARELDAYERLQADATALQTRRLELAAFRRDAKVRADKGEHAEAVAFLQKALEADPDNPASHLDLGIALFKANRPVDAEAQLRAAEQTGAAPDVHRHLSEVYAALNQPEASRRERARYAQARQDALRRAGAAR
jgi:tetratricopeptide (TPR) repeat protein